MLRQSLGMKCDTIPQATKPKIEGKTVTQWYVLLSVKLVLSLEVHEKGTVALLRIVFNSLHSPRSITTQVTLDSAHMPGSLPNLIHPP